MSDEDKKITAYHESGHAIMATVLKDADPVHKVTIIPRGQAGGYTMMLPHEERSFLTKSHLLAQIRVALGGRCAEQIISMRYPAARLATCSRSRRSSAR